jgi:hypothetical protein
MDDQGAGGEPAHVLQAGVGCSPGRKALQIAGYGKQVTTTWALALDQLWHTAAPAVGLLRLRSGNDPAQPPAPGPA